MSLFNRFKKFWDAFKERDPTRSQYRGAFATSSRPDRTYLKPANARSIVSSVYNQISIDVSSVNINHTRVDEKGQFVEFIDSSLNDVLSYSANIDQTGRALIKDLVMSMFDEGCVAVVPTITDIDPNTGEIYEVYELRVGRITNWFPDEVSIEVYNEKKGWKEQIMMKKDAVAIIENPFYAVMNSPNSTAVRLNRVLNMIDQLNDNAVSGKLDLIFQFPFAVRGEGRKIQAAQRKQELEEQLTNSKHGIAYIDATEKVVQLNRPIENNLWEQAEKLTTHLFNQLGFSMSIFDGTANEAVMLNYNNRTIEPILTAIVEEMQRKWITRTARTQGQRIKFFRDPFKLVPVNNIAEIADKFTRNEIMTSNEIRAVIGMPPSDDPKADMLINSNLNQSKEVASEIQNEGE